MCVRIVHATRLKLTDKNQLDIYPLEIEQNARVLIFLDLHLMTSKSEEIETVRETTYGATLRIIQAID